MISARKTEVYNFQNDLYYDIYKLSKFLNDNYARFPIVMLPLDKALLHHISENEHINETWVKDMPMTRAEEPILLAEILNGEARVIDGHHRIHRLHREGRKGIKAILIPNNIIGRFMMSKEEGQLNFEKIILDKPA